MSQFAPQRQRTTPAVITRLNPGKFPSGPRLGPNPFVRPLVCGFAGTQLGLGSYIERHPVMTRGEGWVVYSGYMDNRSARIAALKRYISLLQQEEKRMTWVVAHSSLAREVNRRDAESNLRLTTEKITKAEAELKTLEDRP